MKRWFVTILWWISTAIHHESPAETRTVRLSDYERRLRQLDERAGRLFLP